MKKKKRLKPQIKIIIVLLFLLCLLLAFNVFFLDKKPNKKEIKKEDIEVTILNKIDDDNIDIEFLKWVKSNYKGSLDKLNTLLEEDKYDKKMWHEVTGFSYLVLNDLYNKKYKDMDNVIVLENDKEPTITIVGDVSLADNWSIMPAYDKRNKKVKGILSDDVLEIMNNTGVMIVNSEFTVSKRGQQMAGKQYTFRADPKRLSIYDEMGVDLVTLANNHVYDFGKTAFLDMLDEFDKKGIPRIGAGRNLSEAMKPYFFIVNGYKVGFLNATRAEKYILTPGASKNSEGVFRCYDPSNMIKQIKSIRSFADYIITIIHFGKEGSHELEKEQVSSARKYIAAGSDMVVGHHAHTLQGVEIYKDKPIIYNLGNFIFNSETIDTALYQVSINDDGTLEYKMIPALQKNEYTKLLKGTEKERVIKDINSWSINAKLDKNGIIKKVK